MVITLLKGALINSLEPMTEKIKERNEKIIKEHAKNYYRQLVKNEFKKSSLIELLIFRMSRTSIKTILDKSYRDYEYYNRNGWFESDFYYR